MYQIHALEPTGSDDRQPQSAARAAIAAVQQAQRLDLHLNSMVLGYISASRTILVSSLALTDEIYGEDSPEMKQSEVILFHIEKLVGMIDHKISVD